MYFTKSSNLRFVQSSNVKQILEILLLVFHVALSVVSKWMKQNVLTFWKY